MLAALRFRSPDFAPLRELSEKDWAKALDYCDRTQLTLALGLVGRDYLPDWVRSRIDGNLASNVKRWRTTKSAFREAEDAFDDEGLECVVLKGFSHCPRFVSDPRHRTQGDLDLLFRKEQVNQAFEVAVRLGYHPISEVDEHPIDHLPMMVRKTGWQWRGDFYDAEGPTSLELHFQLWNPHTERFEPSGLDQFWERREHRELEGLTFQAFHPADELGYATLHMLRHLLRGDLRPAHVYELAWHLEHSVEDATFWCSWTHLHHDSLRRLEAICFSLAQRWFDCRLPEAAQREVELLPPDVQRWMAMYSTSPLAARFHPNKDELWLHWSLLDSSSARISVLRRRLLPQLPNITESVHVPDKELTLVTVLRGQWRKAVFLASRFSHHARAMPSVAWSAMRWFGHSTGLGSQYWRFFFAEAFFDFGMFVFVFLYNLYLLQLGFHEDFLGIVAGVMTAGNIAGTLVAVLAMQRFGMRRTLLLAFTGTALLAALRAYVTFPPALIGLAGLAGILTAAWPVAYSPAITQLTTEKNRAFGFSVICSAGISIGILGGLAAGRLPGWIGHWHLARSGLESYRLSLFAGCGFVLLALLPLSRVKFGAALPGERKLHRPSPLLVRFLIAMAAWNLGTGALNPFFNVFFAERVHLPVQQIGYVFAGAQVAQVGAILLSPLIFRKFGLTRGIAGMQMATGLSLLCLAVAGGPIFAALGYSAYMMSQYMSEPGQFTLVMEAVRAPERNSASALNFLVSFAGQAIAAAGAGWLLARFGYPPVMTAAAGTCVIAALLFRVLLANPKPAAPSDP